MLLLWKSSLHQTRIGIHESGGFGTVCRSRFASFIFTLKNGDFEIFLSYSYQGTKKAEQLKKKLLNDLPPTQLKTSTQLSQVLTKPQELPGKEAKIAEGLVKAQAHKDKLLEFDQNHTQRTHVIDDESDYYSTGTGSWRTEQEREALQVC